jgi:hypothetical protein
VGPTRPVILREGSKPLRVEKAKGSRIAQLKHSARTGLVCAAVQTGCWEIAAGDTKRDLFEIIQTRSARKGSSGNSVKSYKA